MYTVLSDQWLAHHSPDTDIFTIRDLDNGKSSCYSGIIDKATAALIFPELIVSNEPFGDKHVRIELDVTKDESSVQLVVTRVLTNGLELRPTKVRLEKDNSQSQKSQIMQLVSYTNEVESRLNQANHELAMTQKVLCNVTSDQQDFEDIVLKRVSEILDDRNNWIKKQQEVKLENKVESAP